MELMGLNEIAAVAGVTPQAVSNWRARADLPSPLTVLASGPIWDGAVVRSWLVATGRLIERDERRSRVKELIKGQSYTHAEVVAAIGGEPVSYLPQSDGRIVGGRFRKDAMMNPEAPERVIVGKLPRVEKKAAMLAEQGHPIPVFLKEGTNRWRYRGRMRCIAFDTSSRAIARGTEHRKEDVAGILVMEDVR